MTFALEYPISRHRLSRRGFCLCCMSISALTSTGGWLTPSQAFAEAYGIVDMIKSEAAKAPITIHKLRGNVSVLEGSGGNIAVLTGQDGKVLVDAGIAVSRPQVAGALLDLGPEPVTHLINTHWHFDHANGNEWLHELGPRIVAHENTRKHLATMQRVEDWDFDFPPLSAGALPTDVFATERSLTLNGSTMALKYYGPAHTDSDIWVHFAEADILPPAIPTGTASILSSTIRPAETSMARSGPPMPIWRSRPTRRSSSQDTDRRSATGPSFATTGTCWSAFAGTSQH